MKTLAVFMMIILAINVSNAVEPASVDGMGLGMHEGAASTHATHCGARFIEQEGEEVSTQQDKNDVIDV